MARLKLNTLTAVSMLIILSLFVVLRLASVATTQIDDRIIVLVFFTIALTSLRRSALIAGAYYFWMIYLLIFADNLTPLSSPDSMKYYVEAFGGGYYRSKSLSDIMQGHIPIVEVGGFIIRFIGGLFSTQSVKIIACVNVILVIEGARLFADFLKRKFAISDSKYFFVFTFLSLSPSIANISLELLKDAYIFFGISVVLSYVGVKKSFSLFELALLAVIILFFSLLRVYFVLLLVPYVLIFFSEKRFIFFGAIFVSLLYLTFAFTFLSVSYFGVLLGSLSSLASPNFLRLNNWVNYPLMTFESLGYTISFVILLITLFAQRQYKLLVVFIYAFIFSGSILVGVSQNRLLSDSNYQASSSLLNDDMSRKKIPFLGLFLCSFFVLPSQFRHSEYVDKNIISRRL
ncbi:hypothetical protein ACPV52_13105 [Vibrio astriarenae]